MNLNSYIFSFFILTSLSFTACTEELAGPNETGLESLTSSSSGERFADLSLRLDVDTRTAGIDSLFVTVVVSNDGPADASGVQVGFASNADCHVERSSDDDWGDGVEDIILVDILGPTARNTSSSIDLVCVRDVYEYTRLSAEIVRSDLLDPDSTPGNGDASEDDYDDDLLEPEVPPCPDCPY